MIFFARHKSGFTVIEMLISITLFALILTGVVWAIQGLGIARIKSTNRTDLIEQLYFFSEQLFTNIKDGGTIDYEEYWNRTAVGTNTASGHYTLSTGVGNYSHGGSLGDSTYGSGIYLCRSNGGLSMGTGGCLEDHNNGAMGLSGGGPTNFSGSYQRYLQYKAQFMDYNGNADDDIGDENGDGNIIGDDDDLAIGDAPAFGEESMRELYLIDTGNSTRTFFRWSIHQDPDAPTGVICDINDVNGKIQTSSGCVGNIQVLKMTGHDLGVKHDGSGNGAYDGLVDTWVVKKGWPGSGPSITSAGSNLATGRDDEWVDLFPSEINVKSFGLQIFPVKDPWLSWGATDAQEGSNDISPFIHPYIRFTLEMGFSWKKRRAFRNEDPTISIATTVSLGDFMQQ